MARKSGKLAVAAIAVWWLISAGSVLAQYWKERLEEPLVASDLGKEIAAMEKEDSMRFLAGIILRGKFSAKMRVLSDDALILIRSIDGVAIFYADRLEKSREDPNYDRYRSNILMLLTMIGSDEAITVLAHYLDDESDTPTFEEILATGDGGLPSSNAIGAVRGLQRLKIEGAPPSRKFGDYSKDLEPWRKWWKEKGRARFDPDGKVSEAIGGKVETRSRNFMTDEESKGVAEELPVDSEAEEEIETTVPVWIWYVIIGGGLFAALRIVSRRQRAS